MGPELGSGFILNGSLYTGASGYGGEFGHTVIEATTCGTENARLCGCGSRGCLETFVSATGMVPTAEATWNPEGQRPTSELIYQAAVQGDAIALRGFRGTGTYLGIGCANLINLLNLEMIVIGGGVMASGEVDAACAAAKYRAFPPPMRSAR